MLRPMRSYLWRGLSVTDRAQAQLAFFDWLLKRYTADVVQAFYERNSYEVFPKLILRVWSVWFYCLAVL